MALIDRIKYDGPPAGPDREQVPWLVYRFPSDNLVLGSELIVNRNQEVIFFHEGNALDLFGPGTHTLSTANLPLLQSLFNLPFGVGTPINAEVYFVNKVAKLDVKWGTIQPLQITDPRYQIIVRVRGYGQFSAKILDSRNFVSQVIGALHGNQIPDYQTVSGYFRRLVLTKVKDTIADMMIDKKTSVVDIMASIDSVSTICRDRVASEFDRFGIEMLDFFIESINIPEEDMAKISELNFKEALNLSKSKGDFKKSAYYCGDLVMLYMKKGDLINAYKYTSNLAGYAEGEAKPLVEEFCGQLEARINAGIKEPPEELVKKAEVICHKIRVGP